jgi:uncharacterized NAD(P)/FAD-binding protein YdhS
MAKTDVNPHPEGIAVIGGGFSGVMTAVNLARLARQPLHLTPINQCRSMARGTLFLGGESGITP